MSLYQEWRKIIAEVGNDAQEQQKFWSDFCLKEQKIYEDILENNVRAVEGNVIELSEKYNISVHYFMGFIDGINESIFESVNLEEITENTNIKLDIDFPRLYKNMLAVPADWLYNLPQWDNILTGEERKQIRKDYNRSRIVVNDNKVGRNDPCPCGSGKKYKKCCGA